MEGGRNVRGMEGGREDLPSLPPSLPLSLPHFICVALSLPASPSWRFIDNTNDFV